MRWPIWIFEDIAFFRFRIQEPFLVWIRLNLELNWMKTKLINVGTILKIYWVSRLYCIFAKKTGWFSVLIKPSLSYRVAVYSYSDKRLLWLWNMLLAKFTAHPCKIDDKIIWPWILKSIFFKIFDSKCYNASIWTGPLPEPPQSFFTFTLILGYSKQNQSNG